MARTINSPGIQITETDLSLIQNPVFTSTRTTAFVPGFAAQGPTDEVLNITSILELESIYGLPESPAEKYFYHTCKEILRSPANLLTTRLPYGSGAGAGFASQYSALLYPTASAGNSFFIGAPTHISLNESTYNDLLNGNFTWGPYAGTSSTSSIVTVNSSVTVQVADHDTTLAAITAIDPSPDTYSALFSGGEVTFTFQVTSTVTTAAVPTSGSYVGGILNAGIVVINHAQTTINENFEGYYISLTDNDEYGPASDFTAVSRIKSLISDNTFYTLPPSKLNFNLSATQAELGQNSISEVIESVPRFDFGDNFYKDSLILNVFKIRNSIYEPQILDFSLVESFIGSLDSSKKTIDGSGLQKSFFLESTVNNSSTNIKLLINPHLSQGTIWSDPSSNNPIKSVRGASGGELKSLYPVGDWKPVYNSSTNKLNGNVPRKLERALSLIESKETVTLDLVVDGGLSTIFANGEQGYYDDSKFVTTSFSNPSDPSLVNWKTIFNIFNSFVKENRRDCMFISDPLRQIFLNGPNNKNSAAKGFSFSNVVYVPLKNLFAGINTNYTAAYANWVKVYDGLSDKQLWIPISGFVTAIYARNDEVAQPWSAPAGLNRGVIPNIIDLAFNPNQKQRDFLYTIALNPVVFFAGDGFTVFGQKTLQTKPTAFDRVNVRRLFLSLERSIQNILKYFVFEPNTEFTRTRARNAITPVLEFAKNTEGLYDFLVVLDERNNTPETIDRNEMVVDIYIKPVRTAEFILLNFVATRTGQDFQELI